MTFKDKWAQDHPEREPEQCIFDCPDSCGYEENAAALCRADGCVACWNREMPEGGETDDEAAD